MRAAWYETNGPAAEVLKLGELPDPQPGPGELRANGVLAACSSMGEPKPVFPYYDLFRQNPVIRPVLVYSMSDAAKAQAHADIARWIAEAKPQFAIAARFPLSDVVQAHLAVERGEKIGHVILAID